MSHVSPTQRSRARRGRRRKHRPRMKTMAAYTPRASQVKWATVVEFARRHPDRRRFTWGKRLKAPLKKLRKWGYGTERD